MTAAEATARRIGVMVVSSVPANLGDDIQALAQLDVLRQLDVVVDDPVLIDREELADYRGDDVCMLMNGWYMHDVGKFPPSMSIFPLFVGVHIDKPSIVETNADYFKAFEPIGCRDAATEELFTEHGVAAYLSACPTLAFRPYDGPRDGVLLVDVNSDCSYIPDLEARVVRSIPEAVLDGAEVVHHDVGAGVELGVTERLDRARGLLERYRRAELVITSRLHCALPCRAFGTPVIFLHRDYDVDPRFSGLHALIGGSDERFEYADSMRLPPPGDDVRICREALLADVRRRLEARRML